MRQKRRDNSFYTAVPLFLFSSRRITHWDTDISRLCNGSSRLHLLDWKNLSDLRNCVQHNRSTMSSTISYLMPRTCRHFSESSTLSTSLCHRVFDIDVIAQLFDAVKIKFNAFKQWSKNADYDRKCVGKA